MYKTFCSDEDRLKIIDGLTQQTFIQEQAEAKTLELMEKKGFLILQRNMNSLINII